jgi:hypothetical protein
VPELGVSNKDKTDSSLGCLPSIEHLRENGQEEQTTGEDEQNEDGNEPGNAPEVMPDFPLFLGGPWLASVSDLHKETHEPLNRKDVGKNGVSVAGYALLDKLS